MLYFGVLRPWAIEYNTVERPERERQAARAHYLWTDKYYAANHETRTGYRACINRLDTAPCTPDRQAECHALYKRAVAECKLTWLQDEQAMYDDCMSDLPTATPSNAQEQEEIQREQAVCRQWLPKTGAQ